MLNCYYIYAIVWVFAIFLYDLGWSSLLPELDIHIRIFIYFTILVSIILGYTFRHKFKFFKLEEYPDVHDSWFYIIVILQIIEYIYCRKVPLISVVLQGGSYKDFSGIPTLHVIIYTLGTFYSQYLFYLYLCFKKKKLLFQYGIILFAIFGLQYMRGGLLVCLIASGLMWVASIAHKIKIKHIIISILTIIIVLYLFGVTGNIRQGYSWNDSSAFTRVAGINDSYPKWLAKEFAWTYIYITISLGNLNYNVLLDNAIINYNEFFKNIVPDFLAKRFFDNEVNNTGTLIVRVLNTSTGYLDSYLHGEFWGMYIMYTIVCIVVIICLQPFILEKYRMPVFSLLSVVMALTFFTNTLAISSISFPLFYPIVLSLFTFAFGRIKIKISRSM